MLGRIVRRVVGALACVGVIGLAILPPEHVHAAAADGRRLETVHRHLAPHHVSRSQADGDDGQALWLDAPYCIAARVPLPALTLVILGSAKFTVDPRAAWLDAPSAGAVPIHDPPMLHPRDFRGPPATL